MEFQPMSPDEIERTIQFLLRQQTQFEASMVRVEANLEKLSTKTDNIADGLIGLTGIVGQLTNNVFRLVNAFQRQRREDHGHTPS